MVGDFSNLDHLSLAAGSLKRSQRETQLKTQTSLCTGRAAGLVTVIQTEGVLAGGWDWEGQAHLKTRRRKEI